MGTSQGQRAGTATRRAEPVRVEGTAKLAGVARFTDDLHVPGAWFGATVRSTEPHARLLGLERDPAADVDWSSVVVVTAAGIPGENLVPVVVDGLPALADGEVVHVGQAVALVAAPDPTLAAAARDALRPMLEPLPAQLDMLAATTVFRELVIATGDAAAGLVGAATVLDGEYRTGHQEHLYLEPQAVIAIPEPGGGCSVIGSMQCPYSVRSAVASVLGVARELVTVAPAETGGGFGGKEDVPSMLAAHAALLARAAARPVRLAYDRHEDIAVTSKRHPSVVRHRTGVDAEGRLVAQEIDVVLDGGAFATMSPLVIARAAFQAAGPYRCPNVHIRARAVMTNTPPNGAFRGFGGPQVGFAVETQLNRLAERLGASPVELRRRNVVRPGDTLPTGGVLDAHTHALDVLEAAAEAAGLGPGGGPGAARAGGRPGAGAGQGLALEDPRLTGVGIAMGWHGAGFSGLGEVAQAGRAAVELTASGRIRVLTSSVEMGQGARTVLAQVVANALDVPVDQVTVVLQQTGAVPDSGATSASRSTMLVGALLDRAASHLREDVEALGGGRPFAECHRSVAAAHGPMRVEEELHAHDLPDWDDAALRGSPFAGYSWSCAVASVAVDADTGEVRVASVVHAVEAGRILNHVLAEGQVEGGTLQAVGFATMEELQTRAGRPVNDRLATYLVPTAADAPRIVPVLVERAAADVPGMPHGARGLGELPMEAPAPAVIAAIAAATGAWITSLPATPERILPALEAARNRPGGSEGSA